MSIDNVKGIRIKQMTEHTASIALLAFFSPYRKPEKTPRWERNIVYRIQYCSSDHVLK